MLIGNYTHNADAKGRIFMPVKLREDLGDSFYVTRGVGKCLFVMSVNEWERLAEKFKDVALTNTSAQSLLRMFFANASLCEPDKQGRILLQQPLRDLIGLAKEAVITGVMTRVEIWSKEGWDDFNRNSDETYDQMLAELAPLGI
jgi:MraZ protein